MLVNMSTNQNNSGKETHGSIMTRRTFLTLSTGASLTGIFLFYNAIVTPLAKPPDFNKKKNRNQQHEEYFQPPIYKEIADAHLSEYSWVKQAEYLAKSDSTYLYSKKNEINGSELTLEPFAMVLMRPDKDGNKQAYTIECPKAIIKFQNKLDFQSSEGLGRIIQGKLSGDVEITGPDNLRINGKNFYFNEDSKKIYSDDHLDFVYQSHKGNAIGIDIELLHDATRDEIDQLALNHADKIKLRKNVLILMKEDNEEKIRNNEPLESMLVSSEGSFTFFLDEMNATFEKNVRVSRLDLKQMNLNQEEKYDRLYCDKLKLTLDDSVANRENKKKEKKPSKTNTSLQDNMTIKRLEATGKEVILKSAGNQLLAKMNNLVYDRIERLLTMTANDKVEINRAGNIVHSPVIEAKHTEENKITHTWCKGEGDMKYLNEDDGKIAFSANWKKELTIQPYQNPSTGIDLIVFKENAQIKQPLDQSGLAAESIYVWVKRNEEEGKKSSGSEKDSSGNFEIQRMLALEDVVMVNPQMNAKTDQLRVYFEKQPAGKPKKANSSPVGSAQKENRVNPVQFTNIEPVDDQPKLIPSSGENLQTAQNQEPSLLLIPNQAQSPESANQNKEPIRIKETKPEEPALIQADLIKVRILVNDEKEKDVKQVSGSSMSSGSNQLDELHASGNVHVSQLQQETGKTEDKILCDALHVTNKGMVFHIYGGAENIQKKYLKNEKQTEHPAEINDRGFRISGRMIHMDRENNHAEVEGAGLLELPVTETMEGEKLETPQKVTIWWDEKMTFDGKNAKFYGNVRTDMDTNHIECEEMSVVLKEKISLSEMDQNNSNSRADGKKQKTDIETLDCYGTVKFESRTFKDDLLLEVREGNFAELHLERGSGNTVAQGPGKIKSWRRGDAPGFGSNKEKEKEKKKKDDQKEKPWQYSRILFYDKTKGNLHNNQMSFTGRINIIHGPVSRALEELDPDYLPEDAGMMRCDKLQVIHHPDETKETDGHFEMIASGDAKMEAGKYLVQADQITYDESKDLYIARSLGKQKSTVWEESEAGGRNSYSGQSFWVIPSQDYMELDKGSALEGSF